MGISTMRVASVAGLLLLMGVASTIAAPILGEDAAAELGVEDFGAADTAQLAPESGAPDGVSADSGKGKSAKGASVASEKDHAAASGDSSATKAVSGNGAGKDSAKDSSASDNTAKETTAKDDVKTKDDTTAKDATAKDNAGQDAAAKHSSDKDTTKQAGKDAKPKESSSTNDTTRKDAGKASTSGNGTGKDSAKDTAQAGKGGSAKDNSSSSTSADSTRKDVREGLTPEDDEADNSQHTKKKPFVAKQPIVVPKDAKDDNSPMPRMPKTYPFSRREDSPEDALDQNDPDPYKQRGTYTKEMKEMDEHLAWERANPVKENGETRPWDDLNDFKDANDKVEKAKQIANSIYDLTKRKVAKKAETEALDQKLKEIKRNFHQSTQFLKRVIKKSKEEDHEDRKEGRENQRRATEEKSKPSKAIKNRLISELQKEDDELVAKLPTEPAPWAVQAVLKSVEVPGKKTQSQQNAQPQP